MSQARSPCSCDALRKAALSTPSGASSEGAGHTLPRTRNLCVRIPFLAPRALPIRPPWLMRDGPLGTRLARTLYRPSKDSEIPLPMYPALARAPKTFGHCSCCPNDARPTASVRKVKMGLHFFMRPVYLPALSLRIVLSPCGYGRCFCGRPRQRFLRSPDALTTPR